jgi:anti-sigma regulatory factor (Ser/Thr protein kinase)
MRINVNSELRLPLLMKVIPLVRSHVRELGALAGLPPERVEALDSSVLEGCRNIMKYAATSNDSGSFILRSELTPSTLTVSLLDHGIPFDDSLSPKCPVPFDPKDMLGSASDSGLCRIRNLVDRMEWINRGKEGKELRLTLYNVRSRINGQSAQEQLGKYCEDETLAPSQSYRIRRLQSADATWVSRVVFRAYGYTYPIEDLYYPDRVVRLNHEGKLISAVAESAAGEIVGYCALKRASPSYVAEVGQAVVNPSHRGRKLLQRMHAFLEEEALKQGLAGLSLMPVTSHMHSQKIAENLGFRVCGLALGLLPPTLTFKKLHDVPLRQRESCLVYFKTLAPPMTREIYAPDRHREILRQLYTDLGIPVTFLKPARARGGGRLEVNFNAALGLGEILIRQIGAETPAALQQARRDLTVLSGTTVISLQIPLSQPGAPEIYTFAESEGFLFSALCPGFMESGDTLRLQCLSTEIDLSLLQVFSSKAKEMLQYLDQERRRVGRGS